MTTTILYRYTTELQNDTDLLARVPLDEFGTIQFVLLVVLVIPVALVSSAACQPPAPRPRPVRPELQPDPAFVVEAEGGELYTPWWLRAP